MPQAILDVARGEREEELGLDEFEGVLYAIGLREEFHAGHQFGVALHALAVENGDHDETHQASHAEGHFGAETGIEEEAALGNVEILHGAQREGT